MAQSRVQAKNTFGEGIIMDFSPDNTQANVLSNALNATLLTYNGNEMNLQNDMGNGRVETAMLPTGYMPVGTCEFGGIIYIVSYNPQDDLCQIGCFPSPERNITQNELTNQTQITSITNETFQGNNGTLKSLTAKVIIRTDALNPGDKYIITNTNEYTEKDLNCLSDLVKEGSPKHVKLSVVSIEDSGKITKLETQRHSVTIGDEDYSFIIPYSEENPTGDANETDIDSYRKKVSQNYNVFSSKVSGKLAILAELETISTFSCSHKITLQTSEDENGIPKDETIYNIYLDYTWESDNEEINPKYIAINNWSWNIPNFKGVYSDQKKIYYIEDIDSKTKNNYKYQITTGGTEGEYEFTTDKKDLTITLPQLVVDDTSLFYHELTNNLPKESSWLDEPTTKYTSSQYSDHERTLIFSTNNGSEKIIVGKENEYESTIGEIPIKNKFGLSNTIYICSIKVPNKIGTEEFNLPTCVLSYTVTPAMEFGLLEHLAVTNELDLSKLGKNVKQLNTLRYYASSDALMLTLEPEIYDTETETVTGIGLDFYDMCGFCGSYSIDNRESFSGDITLNIPFRSKDALNPYLYSEYIKELESESTDSSKDNIQMYHYLGYPDVQKNYIIIGNESANLNLEEDDPVKLSGIRLNDATTLADQFTKANVTFSSEYGVTTYDPNTYNDCGILYEGFLYAVKMTYRVKKSLNSETDTETYTEYFWVYTTGDFNEHYYNNEDFRKLNLEIPLIYSLPMESNVKREEVELTSATAEALQALINDPTCSDTTTKSASKLITTASYNGNIKITPQIGVTSGGFYSLLNRSSEKNKDYGVVNIHLQLQDTAIVQAESEDNKEETTEEDTSDIITIKDKDAEWLKNNSSDSWLEFNQGSNPGTQEDSQELSLGTDYMGDDFELDFNVKNLPFETIPNKFKSASINAKVLTPILYKTENSDFNYDEVGGETMFSSALCYCGSDDVYETNTDASTPQDDSWWQTTIREDSTMDSLLYRYTTGAVNTDILTGHNSLDTYYSSLGNKQPFTLFTIQRPVPNGSTSEETHGYDAKFVVNIQGNGFIDGINYDQPINSTNTLIYSTKVVKNKNNYVWSPDYKDRAYIPAYITPRIAEGSGGVCMCSSGGSYSKKPTIVTFYYLLKKDNIQFCYSFTVNAIYDSTTEQVTINFKNEDPITIPSKGANKSNCSEQFNLLEKHLMAKPEQYTFSRYSVSKDINCQCYTSKTAAQLRTNFYPNYLKTLKQILTVNPDVSAQTVGTFEYNSEDCKDWQLYSYIYGYLEDPTNALKNNCKDLLSFRGFSYSNIVDTTLKSIGNNSLQDSVNVNPTFNLDALGTKEAPVIASYIQYTFPHEHEIIDRYANPEGLYYIKYDNGYVINYFCEKHPSLTQNNINKITFESECEHTNLRINDEISTTHNSLLPVLEDIDETAFYNYSTLVKTSEIEWNQKSTLGKAVKPTLHKMNYWYTTIEDGILTINPVTEPYANYGDTEYYSNGGPIFYGTSMNIDDFVWDPSNKKHHFQFIKENSLKLVNPDYGYILDDDHKDNKEIFYYIRRYYIGPSFTKSEDNS